MNLQPSLTVFVATRREQVPPRLGRYISVDGTVPGAVLCWDHHVTGERINLDAMPDVIDTRGFDGVGTTLADADAVASVVAVLLGGKAALPPGYRATLEAASHWCDHLAPHPQHDDEHNRLGRGLLDAINDKLAHGSPSDGFASACLQVFACIQRGEPLPFSDRWSQQQQRAEQLDLAGKILRTGPVAVIDLRGAPPVEPLATYLLVHHPVAVAVDGHARGGLRYTVGVNPSVGLRPDDLGPALRALAAAEFSHGPPCLRPEPVAGNENWGGRRTVFGSPWNYGSRLAIPEVARLTAEALGLG